MAKSRARTRQRKLKKRKPICVIATEGEVTEPIYFNKLREIYRDKYIFYILPTDHKGKSSPKHVVQRIIDFKRKKVPTVQKEDEFWAIVDRDNWSEEELMEAHRECQENGFNLAVSNPCFELWLNFHQEKPKSPKTCKDCAAELTKLFKKKYDKSNYDTEKLISEINHAIKKAEQLHKDKSESFPKETGTHVYLLAKKITQIK